MAAITNTVTYNGGKYTFTVSYSYTNTNFYITGIKTKCKESGWATWSQMPSLYFYILKGDDPVKKTWQTQYSGTKAKNHITNHGGVYQNYHGNSPSKYLSNIKGNTVTWNESAFSKLNFKLSGSKVTITMGSFIINTTNTLSSVAYGHKTITLSLYTKPSSFNPSIYNRTYNSITVKATWTNGSQSSKAVFKLESTSKTISTSGKTATFNNLKGNTTYTITAHLSDNTGSYHGKTLTTTTKVSPVTGIYIKLQNTTTIKVKATSSNTYANDLGYQYRYKLKSDPDSSYTEWSERIDHMDSYRISNLSPNNLYSVQARAQTSKGTNTTIYTIEVWTMPEVELNLRLLEGSEHNTIVATAYSIGSDSQIKYIFRLDSNDYNKDDYNKEIPNPTFFTNLKGHSTHYVSVKSKNMISNLESFETTNIITTWYDPIYSLSCNLVNKWFWLLSIKAVFNYQGGVENIKKYEFGIFKDQTNNSLTDTNTTNLYSKGSIIPGNSENLEYNTNYNCMVKLTDNYNRTYTANAIFKTLDERPLYLNGTLSEVKMIKPSGKIEYITPNLLNAIQVLDDGSESVVNMNRIINKDNRTDYE